MYTDSILIMECDHMAAKKEAKETKSEAKAEEKTDKITEMSKEEQIGFHKGSLSVLAKEREEMLRILSIVEQLMQMHVKGLQDLGVDLQAQARAGPKGTKKPIDELI
jgi:hypothetical protein